MLSLNLSLGINAVFIKPRTSFCLLSFSLGSSKSSQQQHSPEKTSGALAAAAPLCTPPRLAPQLFEQMDDSLAATGGSSSAQQQVGNAAEPTLARAPSLPPPSPVLGAPAEVQKTQASSLELEATMRKILCVF